MEGNLLYSLADIGRAIRKRFDIEARRKGITGAQLRAIATVKRHPGINQGQVAELLEVEPITTCRMIDRLEQAGWVERRRDPNDRRAWRIFLTESATPLIDELHEIGVNVLDVAMSGLTGDEIDQLKSLLERLRANLQQEKLSPDEMSDQMDHEHG